MMTMGIIRTSHKEHEKRVPIYPDHLQWIPETIRKKMYFEVKYGEEYGYSDEWFSGMCGGMLPRKELFKRCDLIVLPKPVVEDLNEMSNGQVLWGWSHCVQQRGIAQAAIDRKLTLISWESMHQWSSGNEKLMHIFYKNNEIAGYAAVLHMLQLLGMDGHYGPRKSVAILGYGSVSRGAIYALQGRGFNNIHVFTRRPIHLVADQNPDVYYSNFFLTGEGLLMARLPDGEVVPLIDQLAEADIICNGVLQDVEHPLLFVDNSHLARLKRPLAIIDISCDEGMGFAFARPTSFSEPIVHVTDGISYYSVDHTPTYLWNAASREISRALIPFLGVVSQGSEMWEEDPTVRNAIDVQNGVVRNDKLLSFQKRRQAYPHEVVEES
jgi:alanine dehydrogenase